MVVFVQIFSDTTVFEVNRIIQLENNDHAQNFAVEGHHKDDDTIPLLDQILAMNLNEHEDEIGSSEDDNADGEDNNTESDSSTDSELDELLNQ